MTEALKQSSVVRVAICIATYRRPAGLRRALQRLADAHPAEPPVQTRVIVINNDPTDAATRGVCEDFRARSTVLVECRDEPRQGISFARNAALDAAIADSDFIAFIDDDEAPRAGWLAELLRVQRSFRADVVTGPVEPVFEQPPPPPRWILRGGFFERRRQRTGRVLNRAYTNNVLIRAELLRQTGVRFDARFARTGGEDVMFFRTLAARGAKIVWADDAVVEELIPHSRLEPQWLTDRMHRIGTLMTMIALERGPPPAVATRVIQIAKAFAWLFVGASLRVAGALAGKAVRVHGRRFTAYGRGLLRGLSGTAPAGYGEASAGGVNQASTPGE